GCVHVADHSESLGAADCPELAVGAAVEVDRTLQAVGVEVVVVDDAGDAAVIAGSFGEEEGARLDTTLATGAKLCDQLVPVDPPQAQERPASSKSPDSHRHSAVRGCFRG